MNQKVQAVGASLAHVQVPPEVASAFTLLVATGAGWFKKGGK